MPSAEASDRTAENSPHGAPTEVARSYFEALARHDVEAMARHWSSDGVEDITGIGILRGPAEIAEFFGQLHAALPDNQWTVERITGDDRVAFVQWRSSGTFSGEPFQGLLPTGRLIDQRGCDCIEVQDGLIVRNTAYQDGLTFARAVGVMPPQDSGAEKALFAAFNASTKLRQTLRDRFAG